MEAAMLHSSREILKVNVTQSLGWSPDVRRRSRWPASISFFPLRCHPPAGSPGSPWEPVPVERRMLVYYKCIVRSQSRGAAAAAMTTMTAPCLLGKQRLPSATSSCLSAASQKTITLMWAAKAPSPTHAPISEIFYLPLFFFSAGPDFSVLCIQWLKRKEKEKEQQKHDVTLIIWI